MMRLEALLDALRAETGGPEALVERLVGVRLVPESLGPYLHFRRGCYTRNLVFRDARFELLLNCWDAGCASPVHDHGSSLCGLSIQAGTFELEDYRLLEGGKAPGVARLDAPRRVDDVRPGYLDVRNPETSVHRVRAVKGPAVSLHLYATPIDRCLVYDLGKHRSLERVLHYDSVFGRAVRTPASAVGAAAATPTATL